MTKKIQSFKEFWPFYLGEHRQPMTRYFHFAGTTFGLGFLLWAVNTGDWRFLIVALVCGYAFAWISHMVFEKNRPATFKYPLWSFIADWKMWAYLLFGQLKKELKRYGI